MKSKNKDILILILTVAFLVSTILAISYYKESTNINGESYDSGWHSGYKEAINYYNITDTEQTCINYYKMEKIIGVRK